MPVITHTLVPEYVLLFCPHQQKMIHPKKVIQDCRELYLFTEVKHLTGKIGCLFEEYMVKQADVVICANKERSKIMKKIYKLDKTPIVYENLRQLQYESDEDKKKAEEKLSHYEKTGKRPFGIMKFCNHIILPYYALKSSQKNHMNIHKTP